MYTNIPAMSCDHFGKIWIVPEYLFHNFQKKCLGGSCFQSYQRSFPTITYGEHYEYLLVKHDIFVAIPRISFLEPLKVILLQCTALMITQDPKIIFVFFRKLHLLSCQPTQPRPLVTLQTGLDRELGNIKTPTPRHIWSATLPLAQHGPVRPVWTLMVYHEQLFENMSGIIHHPGGGRPGQKS